MEKSTKIIILVFLSFIALAAVAYAGCPSCRDGNWQESADAFLEGRPINEDPVVFSAKAARTQSSQFEKDAEEGQATMVASQDNNTQGITLQNISASPSRVNSSATTKITASFAINRSAGADQSAMQLSVNGEIKDSAGGEVAKLVLIRQSDSQYWGNWTADVPPGIYSLDLAAFSLDAAASFKDALQIEVLC